ncbi:MAG: IS66 family transposase [Polyangia bacterium]
MTRLEKELLAPNEKLQEQLEKALLRIQILERENAELRALVAELEEKLNTNSSNSSKPPSSDGPSAKVKKRKRKKKPKKKRKRGAQRGHEGKSRDLLPVEQVDELVDCKPEGRCDCGGRLQLDEKNPLRQQILELPELALFVSEYRVYSGVCAECGRVHRGSLPEGVSEGMLGPRASAAIGMLSGKYRLSKRSVQELLCDLFGLELCLGTVSNSEARVSEALSGPYEEAGDYVRQREVVHADETSHKVAGRLSWMWVAVTSLVSVFMIRKSRGKQSARELLGEEFGGYLVSDRWSGYNWLPPEQRQLCWAHLVRDFKKIAERGGSSGEIGNALLEYAQKMFHLWHRFCDGKLSHLELELRLAPVRREVERILGEGCSCGHAKTERTCRNLLELRDSLWKFVEVPGVEPTNNVAERTIRPYVLWRKSSFGTQSERGNRFVERMMTASATCKQQGRNLLDYLTDALAAVMHNRPPPSLLPESSLA